MRQRRSKELFAKNSKQSALRQCFKLKSSESCAEIQTQSHKQKRKSRAEVAQRGVTTKT
jgi:hypothetical protein